MVRGKEMKQIVFKKELYTGVTTIDSEHEQLIDFYNRLVGMLKNEYNSELFVDVLSDMSSYAFNHFKDEEQFMQSIKYDKIKEHKKYHMEYLKEVSIFNSNFLLEDGTSPEEVLNFLANWWIHHILEKDMDYIEFSKKHR